ncbi:hypothetical protein NL676_020975 [Syzygium grande]|nr:hypothetical protein NL676_020975 [Syzygium grande]
MAVARAQDGCLELQELCERRFQGDKELSRSVKTGPRPSSPELMLAIAGVVERGSAMVATFILERVDWRAGADMVVVIVVWREDSGQPSVERRLNTTTSPGPPFEHPILPQQTLPREPGLLQHPLRRLVLHTSTIASALSSSGLPPNTSVRRRWPGSKGGENGAGNVGEGVLATRVGLEPAEVGDVRVAGPHHEVVDVGELQRGGGRLRRRRRLRCGGLVAPAPPSEDREW